MDGEAVPARPIEMRGPTASPESIAFFSGKEGPPRSRRPATSQFRRGSTKQSMRLPHDRAKDAADTGGVIECVGVTSSLPEAFNGRPSAVGSSNLDPLDFIEGDLVAGAVVKLGRARAFVCGHCLGVFERAASLHIRGYAGRAEYVAAELAV